MEAEGATVLLWPKHRRCPYMGVFGEELLDIHVG